MKELIFACGQFRIRVLKGKPGVTCSTGDLCILESEDDGNWYKKAEFDAFWLPDLLSATRKTFRSKKVRKSYKANFPKHFVME